MLRLNIVGCGAVGTTLGAAWNRIGFFRIHQLLSRSAESARRASISIGAGTPLSNIAELQPADVWMLAVPDDQLDEVVSGLVPLIGKAKLVFHCSGSMSSQLLKRLQLVDVPPAVASMHPLLGFSDPALALRQLTGAYATLEGDREGVELLSDAARALGLQPVAIDAARKTYYHAGCVFASNYMVTLIKIARDLLGYSGIDPQEALAMLRPLTERNLQSAFDLGPAAALTGPIVRGDVAVVERHIEALQLMFPEVVDLYLNLAAHTVELAAEREDSTPSD